MKESFVYHTNSDPMPNSAFTAILRFYFEWATTLGNRVDISISATSRIIPRGLGKASLIFYKDSAFIVYGDAVGKVVYMVLMEEK